jgi:hypothetical protein
MGRIVPLGLLAWLGLGLGPAVLLGQARPVPPPVANDDAVIPALIEVLRDNDQDTRQYAAMALAAMGSRAVEPLIGALKDKSRERRAAAAYALGQIGPPARAAIPALVQTLKDDSPTVRRQAAYALSRIVGADNANAIIQSPPGAPEPMFPQPSSEKKQ